MQEPIFSSTITRKLFNERAILIGTFLGGPLAGAYLIARNFKMLDEPSKSLKTWLIAVGVFVLLIGTAFVPLFDKIPSYVYSFFFCLSAHSVARKLQGNKIRLHQVNGGQLHSTWRAAAVGIICLLLMGGLFLGCLYLADPTVFE